MAETEVAVPSAPLEDDESWLYGEVKPDEKQENEQETSLVDEDLRVSNDTDNAVVSNKSEDVFENELKVSDDREAGELSGEEELQLNDETQDGEGGSEDDDDDSDSDDDDVQVTIGDIKATTGYGYGGTPVNLNIKRGGAYQSGVSQGSGLSKTKGIDLDGVGNINGVPAYEFNLDSMEEKPWRKPGADITDYFNYGFNEDTWKSYCDKQRKLRVEGATQTVAKVVVHPQVKDQPIPTTAAVNENSKYAGSALKKAGPPPGRKLAGSIDVIGGTTTTSRRQTMQSPKENVIQVMTADKREYGRKPFEGLPPPAGPHLPPGFMPPDLSVPPPGMPPPPPAGIPPPPGLPPPGMPVPPAYAEHYGAFGRPGFPPPPPNVGPMIDRGPPPPNFEGGFYGPGNGAQPMYPFEHAGDSQWDTRERPGSGFSQNWDYPHERSNDRSPSRSETQDDELINHERRHTSRDHRDRSERDKDRERDRSERDREKNRSERDRDHERSRDRDRDRERDRDRDYDYDDRRERDRDRRHREHRDRDKEHRSSRRKHRDDDESEHRSSRHKRKRSKRDKDDDSSATETTETLAGGESTSTPAEEEKKE